MSAAASPLARSPGESRHPVELAPRAWSAPFPDTAPMPRARSRPRRRFALAAVIVLAAVAVAYPYLPRRYESVASLVLQPTDQDGQGDRTLRNPMDDGAVQSAVDVVTGPELIDAVIEANRLAADPEFGAARGALEGGYAFLAGRWPWLDPYLPQPQPQPPTQAELRRRVLSHVQVSRDRRSYTVHMGFWSASPDKAAALTASLADAYLAGQRDRKRRSLERLTSWLAQRAHLLGERYAASTAAVAAFLSSSGLVDTGAQAAIDQRLQVMSVEAAQARARYIDASVRANALAAKREAGDLSAAPEILSSPAILRLKEGMASALARTAVWASETQAIQDQITLESDRIVSAAKAEAAEWAAREGMLSAEISQLRVETVKRREAEPRLQELQRVAASDKAILEEALTRLKGMTAREQALGADAEILSIGEVAGSAAFPRPVPTGAAALMMAVLAGLALTWREALAGLKRLAAP
ncbi:hypothetical protein [Methylobacterium sp. GC_Met_3]|uniref:hypothetical protein n=1 Tax=Methylobacterium sp. GC_Met_3 TaxID=2937375 RepID=UPI00226A6EC9|nr:hypothetical protein [Methylobacterium sp. GC_Met_3]